MGPGASGRSHLRVSVCCNQGGRRYMEDRVSIFCERDKDGGSSYVFLAVFDGHGGSDASEMAQKRLRANIVQNPRFLSDNDDDVLEAIKDGFLVTQSQMLHEVENWPKTSSGFPSTSGTTASVAFIRRNKLYIGHVGDSAIALGKRFPDGTVVGSKLTTDHKPDDPEEQRRISERGGEVMSKSGVKRVVWVRPVRPNSVKRSALFEKIPFLAVARALGDLWSYNSSKDDFVVSPVPDVSMVQLQPDDVCLVIGSDGLWNVLNAQNVVEIVNCNEWKDCPSGWNACESKTCGLEINHARWIARQALIRWGRLRADNISVITVLFDRCNNGPTAYNQSSVINEEEVLDIEQVLTEQPSAVVHILAERVLALRTSPVELFYYGTVETTVNNKLPPRFCGPGYTEYSEGTTLLCLSCKNSDDPAQAGERETVAIKKRMGTSQSQPPHSIGGATVDDDDLCTNQKAAKRPTNEK
uniref:PPM-type phosphatase domain-containing protein n=1 Tax=Trichuris muris TaxID=70415 RepID=A0A5S6QHR5_TRIMR